MFPAAVQVDHLTQHMEASERSMQDRVQRLEAIRIALEEVRVGALGAFGWERRRCSVKSSSADLCKLCHVWWEGTKESSWGIQFTNKNYFNCLCVKNEKVPWRNLQIVLEQKQLPLNTVRFLPGFDSTDFLQGVPGHVASFSWSVPQLDPLLLSPLIFTEFMWQSQDEKRCVIWSWSPCLCMTGAVVSLCSLWLGSCWCFLAGVSMMELPYLDLSCFCGRSWAKSKQLHSLSEAMQKKS